MQGGAAQGAGWALSEGYFYDSQGHLLNASLLDYRVPTCLDLPNIETVIVEAPNPQHPYGVRGVGEVPIIFEDRRRGTTKISRSEVWRSIQTVGRLSVRRWREKIGG